MKYFKYIILPLFAISAFAQITPINNPYLTGTITTNSSTPVTNSIVYANGSNVLSPVTVAGSLTFSGGVLTGNGGGGGGSVFTTLQVGSDAATSSIPINFSPSVTAVSLQAKGLRMSPTINNTADNDVLYGIASGGVIQSTTPHANVNYYHDFIGTPTIAGYTTLNSATGVYISDSPNTGSTTTYGLVQTGVNDNNSFAGKVTFADTSYIGSSGAHFNNAVDLGLTAGARGTFTVNNITSQTAYLGGTNITNSSMTVGSSSITIPSFATGGTGILYTNSSGTLSPVTVSTGLSFSGGVLTATGGGGGSGVSSLTGSANSVLVNGTSGSAQTGALTLTTVQDISTNSNVQFNSMSIGASPITAVGVNIAPAVISNSGSAKGLRVAPTILGINSNELYYGVAQGGIVNISNNTNITFYEYDLGAPTFQNAGGYISNAYQLYLAGFGTSPGATINNKYGIYQAGTETNVFSGVVVMPHYTVSGLPSASTVKYGEAFVSDATQSSGTSIGSSPTGGGSYVRKVYSDGSNWLLE
jgi:hypothetical protein